jgi:hypothetical protein
LGQNALSVCLEGLKAVNAGLRPADFPEAGQVLSI